MWMPLYTLERQDVLNLAINTLAQLPLSPRGDQIQITDLLHLLAFAAVSKISVHQTCQDLVSRNPILRLLFVGVALTLRNVWVWLHAEVIGPTQAWWPPPSDCLAAAQSDVVVACG
jgi:hypothetical protein